MPSENAKEPQSREDQQRAAQKPTLDCLIQKASETLEELRTTLSQKFSFPAEQPDPQIQQPAQSTTNPKKATDQINIQFSESPHQRRAAVARALKIRQMWMQHKDIEKIIQQTGYSHGYIERHIKIADTILTDPELARMITAEAQKITFQDIDTFTSCYYSISRVRNKFIEMAKKDGIANTLKKMRHIMEDLHNEPKSTTKN